MGENIEIGGDKGSDYWAALRWLSKNQNKHELMSLPIANPT
jgi:hypothetical protein